MWPRLILKVFQNVGVLRQALCKIMWVLPKVFWTVWNWKIFWDLPLPGLRLLAEPSPCSAPHGNWVRLPLSQFWFFVCLCLVFKTTLDEFNRGRALVWLLCRFGRFWLSEHCRERGPLPQTGKGYVEKVSGSLMICSSGYKGKRKKKSNSPICHSCHKTLEEDMFPSFLQSSNNDETSSRTRWYKPSGRCQAIHEVCSNFSSFGCNSWEKSFLKVRLSCQWFFRFFPASFPVFLSSSLHLPRLRRGKTL